MLFVLTMVTGLVDAISYLKFGHIFVANMTGNVVFFGFALGGAQDISISSSITAIAAFLAGALFGGRLGSSHGYHRGRFLAISSYIKIILVGVALVASIAATSHDDVVTHYLLIVLLGLAMGLQNAVARRLGVPDLTTTVLTLTLTGLAANSTMAGGNNPRAFRRIMAALTMLIGAAIGSVLVLNLGISIALAVVLFLLCINGIAASLFFRSLATWTVGK